MNRKTHLREPLVFYRYVCIVNNGGIGAKLRLLMNVINGQSVASGVIARNDRHAFQKAELGFRALSIRTV